MTNDRSSRNEFGPLEGEVMEAIWRADGPVSVRLIVDQLNELRSAPLAYTTVMTVMSRLAEKDVLSRNKVGREYIYEATAEDAAGLAVKGVLRDHGDVAVAHFVDQARSDPEMLRRLQRLLSESDG